MPAAETSLQLLSAPARPRRRARPLPRGLGWVLGVLVALTLLALVDARRPPDRQVLAQAGIGAIATYQAAGRPAMRQIAVCRYEPSCSEYTRAAIERYGFWPGVVRGGERIWRCRGEVPLHTQDPP